MSTPDFSFLQAALVEAKRGVGRTSPNPAVGAVIVRDEEIIGSGWHRRAGLAHAEVEALASLPDRSLARGTTLYVTLEPCSTPGRTPPCTEAILEAGIRRVVIGTLDPNPAHAGRGVEILRAAGVEVTVVEMDECRRLNLAFNHWIVTRMPWVIAKAGMSLNGRLVRPSGGWITNKTSRADAHQLRAQVDAILIGGGTIRADNPQLTVRGVPMEDRPQPWRVVVSRSGNLPPESTVFTDEYRDRTLVFTGLSLREVLAELGRREITSVMIEGGIQMLGMAFDERLVNQICFYIAPLLLGGTSTFSTIASPQIINPNYERFGDDVRVTGEVVYPG